ncbi:hypothetical protein DPMN_013289 [Dreissena polymorpha]|uniref:Uncharacterized protein n=1 Tax=Dreissena polymorpha TaxID=45954 RepID=A0A9D4N7F1_DREPO|nr:hypothetical protein DPMN_013289 [Dreissena polymorpha]
MTEGISNLRDDLKSMLKREEIEELIKNTVTTIMGKIEETMMKRIENEVKNITKEFKDQIAGIEYENEQLKQKMDELKSSSTKALSELQTQVDKNYDTSRDALMLIIMNNILERTTYIS